MPSGKEYGSWRSPILPQVCMSNDASYVYLCQDQKIDSISMTIYWIELRSNDRGRCVIVSKDIENRHSENVVWTPDSFSARTTVHEYGGASMFVHDGVVYFSNESDQHLYMQRRPMDMPIRVSQTNGCRYGNGFFSSIMRAIFIVREDHTNGHSDAVNTIVAIRDGSEIVVVCGADFYSSPRVSDDGDRLCWVEWRFPNMPWDNTRVCTALLDKNTMNIMPGSLVIVSESTDSNPLSCTLPMWTRDNSLLYIKDETGFWNIWATKDYNEHVNITPVDENIGDPMWILDYRKYKYSRIRDQIVLARKGGNLELKNVDGSGSKIIELQSILSYICYPELLPDGSVVIIGDSPTRKRTIYHISAEGDYEILGYSPFVDAIDPKYFSTPKHLKFPVNQSFAYGYFYPPCNPDYCGLEGTLPPLLVHVHGGPTASSFDNLNLNTQYWTSRGFAILDVDYRGSTGYDKEYRHSLKRNWGVYDMEDCCEGANYLVKQNLVDGNKLVISGGSAGGYTTLCCLTFSSTFKAGCSLYGVADLKGLIDQTHKFEKRYLDLLIGNYDECKDLYKARSPIHFPEKIKCPMIFFQGENDKIVPKNQSEKMFAAVKAAGIPCSLVMYPGESHGFRKMENIIHQMESEYYFYAKIFGFEAPDIDKSPITIENF